MRSETDCGLDGVTGTAEVVPLRLSAGHHPDDPQLTELIGELSLRSDS
ncbi:hypothetical protein AB0H86_08090 [Streptomyces sp. NPDC050997]